MNIAHIFMFSWGNHGFSLISSCEFAGGFFTFFKKHSHLNSSAMGLFMILALIKEVQRAFGVNLPDMPSGWVWIVFHLPSARTVLHLWFVYSADVQTMLELQRQPLTSSFQIPSTWPLWGIATFGCLRLLKSVCSKKLPSPRRTLLISQQQHLVPRKKVLTEGETIAVKCCDALSMRCSTCISSISRFWWVFGFVWIRVHPNLMVNNIIFILKLASLELESPCLTPHIIILLVSRIQTFPL